MTNEQILEKLEEIEYLLRYYNISGETEMERLINAAGQMGEARVHVEELFKNLKKAMTE